jgi:hypothetical protein
MDALAWEAEPPKLRSPVLVAAFAGWNDAAGAATTALAPAAESLDADLIAQVDPEEFFDFQANRPTISMTEGQTREIEWPGNVLLAATPGAERDLLFLAGTEPNLRWRTFADGIAETAEILGVEMVITLGALIADVATRSRCRSRAWPRRGMVDQLDLARSELRGPTGSSACSHDACGRRGIPQPASGRRCPTMSLPSPTRRRRWPPAPARGLVGVASRLGPGGGDRVVREPGEPSRRGEP